MQWILVSKLVRIPHTQQDDLVETGLSWIRCLSFILKEHVTLCAREAVWAFGDTDKPFKLESTCTTEAFFAVSKELTTLRLKFNGLFLCACSTIPAHFRKIWPASICIWETDRKTEGLHPGFCFSQKHKICACPFFLAVNEKDVKCHQTHHLTSFSYFNTVLDVVCELELYITQLLLLGTIPDWKETLSGPSRGL